jgi:hypothetical protein
MNKFTTVEVYYIMGSLTLRCRNKLIDCNSQTFLLKSDLELCQFDHKPRDSVISDHIKQAPLYNQVRLFAFHLKEITRCELAVIFEPTNAGKFLGLFVSYTDIVKTTNVPLIRKNSFKIMKLA